MWYVMHFSSHEYPINAVPFTEKIVFSPLCSNVTFVIDHLAIYVSRSVSGLFCIPMISLSILIPTSYYLNYLLYL